MARPKTRSFQVPTATSAQKSVAPKIVERLEETLTCAVCFELFNETNRAPKGLPCLHNFCHECLETLSRTSGRTRLSCPLCKNRFSVPYGGVSAIPTNVAIKEMLDLLSKAEEEENDEEDIYGPNCYMCNQHGKECTFICCQCRVGLCNECIINVKKGPHADHKLQELWQAQEELWAGVELLHGRLEEDLKLLEDTCEGERGKLRRWRDGQVALVEDRADTARGEVEIWRREMLDQFAGMLQEAEQTMDLSIRNSQQQIDDLRKMLKQVKSLSVLSYPDALLRYEHLSQHLTNHSFNFTSTSPGVESAALSKDFIINLGSIITYSPTFPQVQVMPPMPSKLPPSKKLSQSHFLARIDFSADTHLSMDSDSGVIINKSKMSLLKFKLKPCGLEIVKEKNLPPEMPPHCDVFQLEDGGVVLRNDINGPTLILNMDLTTTKGSNIDIGRIVGVLPQNRVICVQRTSGNRRFDVVVYDLKRIADGALMTLTPKNHRSNRSHSSDVLWTGSISACCHPNDGLIAVVDGGRDTLDIFDENASSSSLISHPGLSVHGWNGERLRHLSHRDLGLGSREYLHASGASSKRGKKGERILLAVGNADFVTTLHAYDMSKLMYKAQHEKGPVANNPQKSQIPHLEEDGTITFDEETETLKYFAVH